MHSWDKTSEENQPLTELWNLIYIIKYNIQRKIILFKEKNQLVAIYF